MGWIRQGILGGIFAAVCVVVYAGVTNAQTREGTFGQMTRDRAQVGHYNHKVSIATESGSIAFWVEVADTPEKRRMGLMHRHTLGVDEGMWFDFGFRQKLSMWMKDTLIPLDMLFIDHKGMIVHMHKDAVPHDITPIQSPALAQYVLEIPAGSIEMFNISIGDRVKKPQPRAHHNFQRRQPLNQ